MSEVIKVCLKHEFNWMKRDFFFLNGMIILSALICHFLPVHDGVVLLVILFLVVRTLMFTKAYSISPGQGDSFSWKFLQGLPLSKIDLIKLIVISGTISTLPFLLFIVSFWKFISKALFTAEYNILHVILNLVFIFTYFMIAAIYNQIQYPRKEFQKKNASNTLIKSVRFYLTVFVVFLYVLISLAWFENTYGLELLQYLVDAFKKIIEVGTSWWSVPILIVGNFYLYRKTLLIWINEKLSYKPNVWNPRKEYSLIFASVGFLAIAFYSTDFSTPDIYYGKVNTLVYKKKYNELEKALIDEGASKWTNIYGMNPMLVALNEGNLEMVKFLESKGISFNGRITNKKNTYYGFDALMFAVNSGKGKIVEYLLSKNFKSNVFNELSGFYPIHYAANNCMPQMIDVLVKNGTDINVRNKLGETPLIVAARGKCYAAVVTLNEARARFDVTDKSGKTALDHLKGCKKKCSDHLKYYVEKHSRLPASETK